MTVVTHYGFALDVPEHTFFTDRVRENGEWERPESELVRKLVRLGNVCVDAGAHVGYYSRLMSRCGANVLAFEPNPELYEHLAANAVDRQITPHRIALSDTDGEHEFFLPVGNDDGFGSLGAANGDDRSRRITVTTRRLAPYLPLGRIRLVKIDVEGAEALVLRGLGARFTDVDYFLIECIDRPARVAALGSSVAAINALLSGYEVYGYDGEKWKRVSEAKSEGAYSFLFSSPIAWGPKP